MGRTGREHAGGFRDHRFGCQELAPEALEPLDRPGVMAMKRVGTDPEVSRKRWAIVRESDSPLCSCWE